jgi:hypothetical protein
MTWPSRSRTALGWTAWRGVGAYGTLRYAQGRLSGRRSRPSRILIVGAAGAGLAAGLMAGFAIRSRLGAGCGHDHEHGHGLDQADIPKSSTGEQAARAPNGAVTA